MLFGKLLASILFKVQSVTITVYCYDVKYGSLPAKVLTIVIQYMHLIFIPIAISGQLSRFMPSNFPRDMVQLKIIGIFITEEHSKYLPQDCEIVNLKRFQISNICI